EGCDVDEVRIARIDKYGADLLSVTQTEVSPRLATVSRFIDAVAGREIWSLESFATADVDRIRLGRCDRERADGAGRLIVEDRFPRVAVVIRLPDAAVIDSYIEDIRLAGNARGAHRPAGAEWANHAPLQRRGEINLRVNDGAEKEQAEKGTQRKVCHHIF